VRPPGFSSHRRHGYLPVERIHVHIPGLTGRIPGSYLRDKPRHSSFVAITQLENHMSQSYLTDVISKIFWIYINFSWVAPDGSNHSIFHRLCSQSFIVVKMLVTHTVSTNSFNRSFVIFIAASLFSIGCALSAPDGSSPQGYSREIFPGYRLKGYEFFLVHSLLFFFLWSHKPPSPRRVFPYFFLIYSFYYRLLCAEFTSFVNILWALFLRRPINMCL
jgi:hypothetical protein